MKKLLAIAVMSTAFMSQHAFAQAKSFEGFSVGANLTSAKTSVDFSAGGPTISTNANTTGLDLQAQYGLVLGQQFVLGLGLTLGTGSYKAGSISAGGQTAEFSSKNRTAIDITPGFAVSDSLLIYGKVSLLNADVVEEDTPGGTYSKSISGTGYGFGLRNMINKNLYFQVGYDFNKYDDFNVGSVTVKPSSTVLSGGIGYKF